MVKKVIAIMAMVMTALIFIESFITRQPLEIPIVNGENDVNQEVVEQETMGAVKNTNHKSQTAISPYDPIFKEVCSEHGNDWRLMSAIAYHESRFSPDAVSNKGAQGMMQIMPKNAKFFNVEMEDLTDVETNIMVANLLVNNISSMLTFDETTPERDRLSIILACYNGGIGYVFHARQLARRNGENPNSWDVISKYLVAMSNPEYAAEQEVRHFSGVRQTLAYVRNVIGHYYQYRQVAML